MWTTGRGIYSAGLAHCDITLNCNHVPIKTMHRINDSLILQSYSNISKLNFTDLNIMASSSSWCFHEYGEQPLQWRDNGCDSVSNHQLRDCLLNRLFRRRPKRTSKLRVTGLCAGNSPVTEEFLAQMANNAENVSIWWRHHAMRSSKSCIKKKKQSPNKNWYHNNLHHSSVCHHFESVS